MARGLAQRRLPRSARGFTLVELLIALAIGTFVVAALYSLFTVQLKQFVYQDIQMEMHQNARLAMDVLTRTGRAAGMGTNGKVLGALGLGGDVDAALPAIISYDGDGPNGADAITMVSMDSNLVMYSDPDSVHACSDSTVTFDPERPGNTEKLGELSEGEFLLCLDYGSAQVARTLMWEITGVDVSSGDVSVSNGSLEYGDFAEACPDTDNMPVGMECSRADIVTYYIDADDTDDKGAGSAEHPVLMMDLDFESPDDDDVPVVDNIEDLQIEYCLRGDSCTATDWTDEIDSWADGSDTNDPTDVYMIRFSIVVRSSRTDLNDLYSGSRLTLANNSASGDSDHYYRQVLASEVTVRNMRAVAW